MPEALAGGWKAPGRARHGLPCRATASGTSPFCGALRKRGRRPLAINGCGSSSIAWPITTSPMLRKACGACPERASGSSKPNFPAPGAAVTALFPVLITFPRLPPGARRYSLPLVAGQARCRQLWRGQRAQEWLCKDDFWLAMQKELLPQVAAWAPHNMAPAGTVVAGQRGGGLSSMYAGLRWPE